MRVVLALVVVPLAVLAGCKKDEVRPPPAPRLDGSIEAGSIIPPRRDAGPPFDAGDVDAGSDAGAPDVDGGMPPGCVAVPSGDMANRATVTSGGRSLSFDVSTAYATWDPASCATPTVVVGLSDASCSVIAGHRLLFALDAASIESSLITVGSLAVGPGDTRLSVAYVRPAVAGMPEAWGTCAGSSGSIDFTDVGSMSGDRLAGTFDLVLSDCTDPFDTADALIVGSFDVTLEQAFSDVCAP